MLPALARAVARPPRPISSGVGAGAAATGAAVKKKVGTTLLKGAAKRLIGPVGTAITVKKVGDYMLHRLGDKIGKRETGFNSKSVANQRAIRSATAFGPGPTNLGLGAMKSAVDARQRASGPSPSALAAQSVRDITTKVEVDSTAKVQVGVSAPQTITLRNQNGTTAGTFQITPASPRGRNMATTRAEPVPQ